MGLKLFKIVLFHMEPRLYASYGCDGASRLSKTKVEPDSDVNESENPLHFEFAKTDGHNLKTFDLNSDTSALHILHI